MMGKTPRSHPLVKQALAATFPEYRGRKVTVREYTGPQRLTVCWDEGTRDFAKVIVFDRGIGTLRAGAPWQNPEGVLALVDQPPGSLLVVHTMCGQDSWVTITARADDRTLIPSHLSDFAGLLS